MNRSQWHTRRKRWIACVSSACVFLAASCSVETRYRVLTVFFEGVPPPGESRERAAAALAQEQQPPPASFHKAFREGRCAECHLDKKRFLRAAVPGLCWECHPPPTEEMPWNHAPARVGDCLACHGAHESAYPGLLTVVGRGLCLTCHRDSHLDRLPAHDGMDLARCEDCHPPHEGGTHPRQARESDAGIAVSGGFGVGSEGL